MKIKALSVRQPYAGLIVAGIKPIENRSWSTQYRGELLICASQAKPHPDDLQWAAETCQRFGLSMPSELPLGVALGLVALTGMISCEVAPEDDNFCYPKIDHPTLLELTEQMIAWYDPTGWGWILENPRPVRPFAVKGKLGLFQVECDPLLSPP